MQDIPRMQAGGEAPAADSIRQVFDQSPDAYWIIDPASSEFLYANRQSESQLGFSMAEILQRKLGVVDVNLVVSTPDKWREVTAGLKPGEVLRYLADLRCKSGDVITVEITLAQLLLGERRLFFAVTRDISDIAAIEGQLRQREHLLQTMFRTMTEGVLVTDAGNRCVIGNPRLGELLEADVSHAVGSDAAALVEALQVAGDASGASPSLGELLRARRPVADLLLKGRSRQGHARWLLANAQPVAEESLAGTVLTLTDVTELRRSQARVDRMSVTDMLTDLPNRGRLMSELGQRYRHCLDAGGWVALLLLDLDRFQALNEARGYSVGDDLLLRVSDRLRGVVPEGALLARLSADEFGIVLHLDAPCFNDARRLVDALADGLVAAIRRPFITRFDPCETTASVGVVLADGGNLGAETACQYASLALALAKEAGGDGWRMFEPAMLETSTSRYYAEAALRDGLRADELVLHLQPQIELATGRVRGAECLVRWNRRGQGLVGPQTFIPDAERSNLIVAIGDWVVRDACRIIARLQRQGRMSAVGHLSVNISPRQFQQPDFVPRLLDMVRQADVDPRHLCLELTETTLAADTEQVVATLRLLKAQGFGLAIDDFGSGYSSFAYLRRFPVDELKIDKVFVDELHRSARGLAIVRAMLSMADALGLAVVAEGIESADQCALLVEQRCAAGQGYLFSRPMGEGDFVDWLAADAFRNPRPEGFSRA